MAFYQYFRYFTDRQWLILCNMFILASAFFIAGLALYVCFVIYLNTFTRETDQEDILFYYWISMVILALLDALCSSIGIAGAFKVSLDVIVTYFWMTVLLLAPTLLFAILTFEFRPIFKTWIRHRWPTRELSSVRRSFCIPESTYNTKCQVFPASLPSQYNISGFSIDDWCLLEFNATDCGDIYYAAIERADNFAEESLSIMASAIAIKILFLFVSLYLAYRIVTISIIMKSMNDLINYLLVFPAIACTLVGLDLSGQLSRSNQDAVDFSQINPNIGKIGVILLTSGLALGAMILVGVYGGRTKRRAWLYLYFISMCCIVATLLIGGVWSYLTSYSIQDTFSRSNFKTQQYACDAQLYNCCCCADDVARVCPEWTKDEVLDYLVVYLRLAGLCGFASLLFVVPGMFQAQVLAKNLREYKCEYI